MQDLLAAVKQGQTPRRFRNVQELAWCTILFPASFIESVSVSSFKDIIQADDRV